jgi:hypothetical protein
MLCALNTIDFAENTVAAGFHNQIKEGDEGQEITKVVLAWVNWVKELANLSCELYGDWGELQETREKARLAEERQIRISMSCDDDQFNDAIEALAVKNAKLSGKYTDEAWNALPEDEREKLKKEEKEKADLAAEVHARYTGKLTTPGVYRSRLKDARKVANAYYTGGKVTLK